MRHKFLVHHAEDTVGVAVHDIDPGRAITGRIQSTGRALDLDVVDHVPLGHKLALRDIAAGDEVVKYGVTIGRATNDIRAGQHVHVHNVKGQRWR
jgi:(2R)-sulfolactate sulfo-lyase subunit alpha